MYANLFMDQGEEWHVSRESFKDLNKVVDANMDMQAFLDYLNSNDTNLPFICEENPDTINYLNLVMYGEPVTGISTRPYKNYIVRNLLYIYSCNSPTYH